MNRRSFVQCASLVAAGNVLGLRPFGLMNALAQTTGDYKALVCVFMYGGNDGNNTVIPFDPSGYANYKAIRGPLALAQNTVLQLNSLPAFGLHPSMPELRALVDSGNAAIVANVGTLVQPLTQAQFAAGQPAPANLFSHPDQQMEWQNGAKSIATQTGWAGRIADALASAYNSNASIPMITSMSGDTVFCDGQTTSPVAVSPGSIGAVTCSEGSECSSRTAVAQAMLTMKSGVSLVQADNAITSNAYKYATALSDAVQSVPSLQTVFPANNPLAAQLKQVAQLIQVRAALGVQRQIFFCGIGNFDTHSSQLNTQAVLLAEISQAVAAFYQATQELNVSQQVTTFTMSDFSRTLQPNSSSGSDHGWGSHHLVLGGAVKGGSMYGTYPTLQLSGPDDSGSNGRWIPSTASVQYASTLAQWFGVQQTQLATVFPTLSAFSVNKLGFMG
jgi:uncharacterized protein (DUF1501 family)